MKRMLSLLIVLLMALPSVAAARYEQFDYQLGRTDVYLDTGENGYSIRHLHTSIWNTDARPYNVGVSRVNLLDKKEGFLPDSNPMRGQPY